MVNLLVVQVILEEALEFVTVVGIKPVWKTSSSHYRFERVSARLLVFVLEGMGKKHAWKNILRDQDVLIRIPSFLVGRGT